MQSHSVLLDSSKLEQTYMGLFLLKKTDVL